ncbi:MAG: hypothetical protein NWF05_07505 [Candidatus Bathyarchaeota archaeon]|nr:hypothetical protein [Candidatus Bathyarchaeota archaeon]
MKKSIRRVSFALIVLLSATAMSLPFAIADQTDAKAAIASAKKTLLTCFSAVKEAENAGGNVTSLVATLNVASAYLSEAELAYSRNDSSRAYSLAVQSQTQLSGFLLQADAVRDTAIAQRNQSFLFALPHLFGALLVIGVGAAVWIYFNTKNNPSEEKTDGLRKV